MRSDARILATEAKGIIPMQDLLDAMENGPPKLLELIKDISLSVSVFKAGLKKEELVKTYGRLIRSILDEAPQGVKCLVWKIK